MEHNRPPSSIEKLVLGRRPNYEAIPSATRAHLTSHALICDIRRRVLDMTVRDANVGEALRSQCNMYLDLLSQHRSDPETGGMFETPNLAAKRINAIDEVAKQMSALAERHVTRHFMASNVAKMLCPWCGAALAPYSPNLAPHSEALNPPVHCPTCFEHSSEALMDLDHVFHTDLD